MDSSQNSDQTPAVDMEASVMLPDSTGPQLPDSMVDDQEGGLYDDDENGMGISNDVQLLRQAWVNESLSPEILAYKDELVDRVRSLISRQEQLVEDFEQEHDKALTRMIRFAELNRINFTLRSYLRKRLNKIEAFAIHFYIKEDLSSRLSPQELEYAKEYIDAENKVFQDSILSFLPRDYDSLIHQSEAMEAEVPDMIPEPELEKHVFIKVTDDLGDIPIDENNTFRLQEDDIFAIRYKLVKDYLLQDRIELV
jgi:GINS complex subunit 4